MKVFFKITGVLFVLLLFSSCNYFYSVIDKTVEEGFIHIPREAGFEQVMDSLRPFLKNEDRFRVYAIEEGYPTTIKSGKYKIEKGLSSMNLLEMLQNGEHIETKLVIRNHQTIYHMAGWVSKQIEGDSAKIVEAILKWGKEKDPELNFETVKQYFVPNTYFVYWNITEEDFVLRMEKEYNKLWNEERQSQLENSGMSPLEVVTLASIVQMEASDKEEQSRVAKAYLNRLKKGMKLEADPTSIYAYRLANGFNNKIQRVYNNMTMIPSEYNTYRNKGLPPAPICLPNDQAVYAVLNPADHDYVFFCADPDRPGFHSFTNNYQEHLKNAKKYHNWLKERDIK